MVLQELLPLLSYFERVVVTGPQRSGTTIAAKILAKELDYRLVLEEAFRERNLVRFMDLLGQHANCVIQAPALSSIAHHLRQPGLAVVFMIRDAEDIARSEARIDWLAAHDAGERRNYFTSDTGLPIAMLKTKMWREFQSAQLDGAAFELEYASLAASLLWVGKEQRAEFGPRQTEL